MIQIQLAIGGKEKTFRAVGVNMGVSLDAYSLYKEYSEAEGNYSEELIVRLNRFICDCFGNQFDEDELLAGYADSAFVLYPHMLREVVGYVHDKIVNFPEPAVTPEMIQTMRN